MHKIERHQADTADKLRLGVIAYPVRQQSLMQIHWQQPDADYWPALKIASKGRQVHKGKNSTGHALPTDCIDAHGFVIGSVHSEG